MDRGGEAPVGRVGRLFRSPVGVPLIGVVAVLCLVWLEAESVPLGRFSGALGAAMFLFVCGAVWGMRLVVAAILRRRTPADERPPLRWRRWLAPPAIVAVTVALVVTEVPLRVRFALSRGALDRFARTVRGEAASPPESTERARHQPRWVGLFEVQNVERTPTGMRLLVRDTGFLVQGGFAWDPERRADRDGRDRYRRLDGPWLLWTHDSF